MSPVWRTASLAIAACVAAALWPITPALPDSEALQIRIGAAAIAAVGCALLAFARDLSSTVRMGLAALFGVTAIALLWAHVNAGTDCLAQYDGRSVVIGRAYSPEAATYLASNPGLSPADRLLDAGGDPARIWTAASIRSCRFWVGTGGVAAIPLLAISAACLITGRRLGIARPSRKATDTPASATPAPVYDVFISYRHTEPDKTHALQIVEAVEAQGLRAAIDIRDFAPNEHFLSEMERCIKQSRFVVCVITSQFLASDHTSEEALISKTLDMAERRKRLVPLIFDRVELPVWLHGLVGIDCTPEASVEPLDRLLHLLKSDQPATST